MDPLANFIGKVVPIFLVKVYPTPPHTHPQGPTALFKATLLRAGRRMGGGMGGQERESRRSIES